MYKLLYTEESKKQIARLDGRLKEKIRTAVEYIAQDPVAAGKPLTKELKGRWSYRVESYRIIYRIYKTEVLVLILTVGHRKEVYKKISRKTW